jgi:sugar phosphate isomerase/epimerase
VSPTILVSTGAVTRDPHNTDHRTILQQAPNLGATGFELLVHRAWYGHLDDVVEELRASPLSFPVVHAEKSIGAGLGSEAPDEADEALATLEVNCRAAAAIGAKMLVLHLWQPPTGDDAIERNLDRLPACLDTAEAYNLVLAIETSRGTAGTPLANIALALARDARCRITLDTEALAFHGQLEASIASDWLWADNLVRHVHLKDFDGRLRDGSGRRHLLPGEGTLELQAFLTGLVERRYGGAITLEATAVMPNGELDNARLERIAAIVQQLGGT